MHLLQVASQDLLVDSIHLGVPYGFVAIYHPLVSLAAAIPFTVGGFGCARPPTRCCFPMPASSPTTRSRSASCGGRSARWAGLSAVVYLLRPEPKPAGRAANGSANGGDDDAG